MTTYEIATAQDINDRIGARDLASEARDALARGERLSFVVAKHPASGGRVETLIIHAPGGASGDVGRAGQALGGPAVWGDRDEDCQMMTEDESGEEIHLDGTLSEASRPPHGVE